MVNFGLNSASILGIFLAVAGASLYFLRSVRPEVSRDHDIFFAAVGLLCGFILLFQGWRLDPILQFGQFLLTGSTIFFAVESIRLRQVATEQARRNTPTVDRDRPVSSTRVYREEEYDSDRDRINPDAYNVYDGATPNYDSPRLRGYEDPQPRPSRNRNLRDEEPRTRNPRSREDRYNDVDSPRPRNSRNTPSRQNYRDDWEETDYPQTNRSSSRRDVAPGEGKRDRSFKDRNEANEPYSYDPYNTQDEPRPSTRKPTSNPVERDRGYRNDNLGTRYEDDLGSSYEEDREDVIPTDYVDYQPMNDKDDDYDDYEGRRNE
jgi:hypothetical protein